jgi:hypothetical protein
MNGTPLHGALWPAGCQEGDCSRRRQHYERTPHEWFFRAGPSQNHVFYYVNGLWPTQNCFGCKPSGPTALHLQILLGGRLQAISVCDVMKNRIYPITSLQSACVAKTSLHSGAGTNFVLWNPLVVRPIVTFDRGQSLLMNGVCFAHCCSRRSPQEQGL